MVKNVLFKLFLQNVVVMLSNSNIHNLFVEDAKG